MWTWSYTLSEVNDSALLNLANLLDVERKWAFLENVEMHKYKYIIELSSLWGTSNGLQPLRLQRQDRQLKLSGDLDEVKMMYHVPELRCMYKNTP